MTTKPKPTRRLWPYLAVPALAVLVAAIVYVGDLTADEGGTGGGSSEDLPGSQIEESELEDSSLRPDPAEQHAAAQARLADMLAAEVDAYLAENEAENGNLYVSIAVSDEQFAIDYNGTEQHDTASIVKVEILIMMLRHYGTVDAIPDWALAEARNMIRKSSNEATNHVLFGILDGHQTMREAHELLGLPNTNPNSTEQWGLTQTTAADQLMILDHALFEGLLSQEQVDLAREIMGDLDESQRWGVNAAAAEAETVWMKNGWDTRSDLGGEWIVNSIGVIAGDTGTPVRIAILTGGSSSEDAGIALVEDLAEIAREVIDTDPLA